MWCGRPSPWKPQSSETSRPGEASRRASPRSGHAGRRERELAVHDDELSAAIRAVQERARSRVPQGPLGIEGVTAADLMPLVHARDAAESKVAAIGTVNPRRGGAVNAVVQRFKRMISRGLD